MARMNSFFWYELMTNDPKAAIAFYAKVVGWTPQPFEHDASYTVMNAGGRGVGGIMAIPDEVKAAGGRPGWAGYVKVDDVDKATAGLKAAGGQVHREPADIPHVGRFAVVADPQGAVFMMLKPNGPDMPADPITAPGHVGWHELYAADWEKGFDFYAGQFGWRKADFSVDMGPMGTYQLYSDGGDDMAVGGMMNKPAEMPNPAWGFYFNVEGVEAAAARVKDAGGQVVMGPAEVPGGMWIVNAIDPQGAMFGLLSPTK